MRWSSLAEELKTVLALAGTLILMLLVFAGAYWCSKLVAGGARRASPPGGGRMEVLDRTPMGKDSALVVVRVGGKLLLLGVTGHQIRKLDELDPALYPEGAQPVPDFVTCLKEAWREKTGRQEGPRP